MFSTYFHYLIWFIAIKRSHDWKHELLWIALRELFHTTNLSTLMMLLTFLGVALNRNRNKKEKKFVMSKVTFRFIINVFVSYSKDRYPSESLLQTFKWIKLQIQMNWKNSSTMVRVSIFCQISKFFFSLVSPISLTFYNQNSLPSWIFFRHWWIRAFSVVCSRLQSYDTVQILYQAMCTILVD